MLDDALSSLGSNFPSRFLLGQFFPAFTAVTVNLLLAASYFPSLGDQLAELQDSLDLTELAAIVGVLAFLAAALAFTLSPLLDALRRALEGELLPEWIRAALIEDYRRKAAAARAHAREVSLYAAKLDVGFKRLEVAPPPPRPTRPEEPAAPATPDGWFACLVDKALGWLLGAPAEQAPPDPPAPAPEPAPAPDVGQFDALREAAQQRLDEMEAAFERVEAAADLSGWDLDLGNAALQAAAAAGEALIALREAFAGTKPDEAFGILAMRFDAEAASARRVAARELSKRKSVQRLESAPDDPRPTRFGNLRAALEHYPLSAYGVGFAYLWPRVLLVMEKDDTAATVLGEARTQLDYTMTAMLLVMSSCAAWLVILAIGNDQIQGLLILGVATPLVFLTFYQIALAAQRNLAETIRAALDRYRFAVLTMLHVALPDDGDAERATWRRLQTASAGVTLPEPLDYVHDS